MNPTTIEYEPFSVPMHAEDSRDASREAATGGVVSGRAGGMRQQRFTVAYPRPFGTRATSVRSVGRRLTFVALLIAASVALHAVALLVAELAYAPYRPPSADVRLALACGPGDGRH